VKCLVLNCLARRLLATSLFSLLIVSPAPAQFPQGPPTFSPPVGSGFAAPGLVSQAQLELLARSLANEVQQTADNAQYELSGTSISGQVELRLNALAQAVNAFGDQVRRNSPEMRRAFADFDRAYAELAGLVGSTGGQAPRTSNSLDRLQRLSFQARTAIGSYNPGAPGLPPDAAPGFDGRRLAVTTSNLQISVDRARSLLPRTTNPAYQAASESARNLGDQNRFFQGMQSSAVRQAELWQMAQQLRLACWDLFQLPRVAPVSPQLQDAIIGVKQQLDQVCRLLGIDPNSPIPEPGAAPGTGRIVKPAPPDPAVGGPVQAFQPPPPVQGPGGFGPSGEFLAVLNTALNQSDTYLQTVESRVNSMVQGYQFQAEARKLRSDLLVLNQMVREGRPPRELRATLDQVILDSQALSNRIRSLAGDRGGPVIDLFRATEQSVQRLDQMLR